MNKVILLGRLTTDAEVKEFGKGKEKGKYATFTLAVRKDNENADFISCTAFGITAKLVEKYVSKGQRILVEGRIGTSNYEDEEGNKHYSTKIIVSNIEFADGRKEDQEEEPKKKSYYKN